MKKIISLALLAIALVTFSFSSPALAGNLEEGAKIFNANCTTCHIGGGNVVVGKKTLKKAALEKYNKYSEEAVIGQVTKGKGAMPAFKGKLTDAQIADVAAYVIAQADNDWK